MRFRPLTSMGLALGLTISVSGCERRPEKAASGEADGALADDDEAVAAQALLAGGRGNDTDIVAQTNVVIGQMADVVVRPAGDGEIIRRY